MKKNHFYSSLTLSLITLIFFPVIGNAQNKKALGIGDDAPEIRYSKWIKGKPITSFSDDQLYVLEFWATWCGPCKAAMPHLTELQAEYRGKATFIGVGVWEKVATGQQYESSLPYVEKYVRGNDRNMGYAVIADNNEQYMGNNWLKAAGQNGIPATFIVKNKKIIWIGHPNSLDSTLPKIFNGSYDVQAFKARYEKSAKSGREEAAAVAAVFNPISEAITQKDYNRAFELMDSIKQVQPFFKNSLDMMKFSVLLTAVDEKQAIEFANGLKEGMKSAPSLILAEVYNKDGLSKSTYLWAANNFDTGQVISSPVLFDALASCYAKGGDWKKAVIYQEKAVQTAKKALEEGSMIGTIMDFTVAEYQEKLKRYKISKN